VNKRPTTLEKKEKEQAGRQAGIIF